MPSLLLQFNAEPPDELFVLARGAGERLKVLRDFYDVPKRRLRERLCEYPVDIQDLEALGAVVVTGTPGTLERVTRALDDLDVSVADDATFFAHR